VAVQPQGRLGGGAGRAGGRHHSDEALAAEAAACRDEAAFGELVRRHQGRVRGYLAKVSGNAALADDLAQDTFIRAWDRLASYRGSGNFSAWLMKIAHNEFLQSLRRTARERRLSQQLVDEGGDGELPSTLGGRPDAGVTDLPRLLSVLSEEERSVLVLSYAYGYSHAEIVEVTGLPLGTVKSHIHRGRARVRAAFDLPEARHG
jgi:RNA polymerase sigma-70 factor (ECF subfamily)